MAARGKAVRSAVSSGHHEMTKGMRKTRSIGQDIERWWKVNEVQIPGTKDALYRAFLDSLVVAQRDIERLVVFHHPHHETFGIRFCAGSLFNDLTLSQHLYGLISGNAAFTGSQERMVPPRDASGCCCSLNGREVKCHRSHGC